MAGAPRGARDAAWAAGIAIDDRRPGGLYALHLTSCAARCRGAASESQTLMPRHLWKRELGGIRRVENSLETDPGTELGLGFRWGRPRDWRWETGVLPDLIHACPLSFLGAGWG